MMLDQLQGERDQKIGNICRCYKSLLAESDMVKGEIKALSDRAKSASAKAESLKSYMAKVIKEGEAFEDKNSKISWRKSKSVNVFDAILLTDEYTKTTIEPDKTKIKAAINSGVEVPGAKIEEKQNIQIK